MSFVSSELGELRFHWGGAYRIHYFARPGLWLAQRRDTGETIKARSPEALWRAIREDYAARPVPRRTEPGAGPVGLDPA
jgi:hypothetical protein